MLFIVIFIGRKWEFIRGASFFIIIKNKKREEQKRRKFVFTIAIFIGNILEMISVTHIYPSIRYTCIKSEYEIVYLRIGRE